MSRLFTALRIVLRLPGILMVLGCAPLLVWLQRLCPIRGLWTVWAVQAWYRLLIAGFGLQVRVVGQSVRGPVLLVANHVSWLDIPVIGSRIACLFVAKSEVRDWPLVGGLARSQDTLFLDRGRGATPGFNAMMARRLSQGRSVALFPEGTTSDGREVGLFHARLFQSAIDAGADVLPVTINYVGHEAGWRLPYINEDSLLQSIWRILGGHGMGAELVIGEALNLRDEFEAANITNSPYKRNVIAERARRAVLTGLRQPTATGHTEGQTDDAAPMSGTVAAR